MSTASLWVVNKKWTLYFLNYIIIDLRDEKNLTIGMESAGSSSGFFF